MFHELLVPVDFTGANHRAITAAGVLARQFGATIHLLHVIQAVPGLSLEEERPFYAHLEESARDNLAAFSAGLGDLAARCRATVTIGNRLAEILTASSRNTDLIVLSSHRVTTDGAASRVGTLSHRIATLAPCAVLLVKD